MTPLSWMVSAILSFSLMAISVRELSDSLSAPQIIFIRGLICLFIISILFIAYKKKFNPSHLIKLHLVRNISHLIAQYGWVIGITLLPLAEVFTLEFTTPFWAAIFAYFFLRERIYLSKVVGIATGFIGVLFIVQPGSSLFNYASIIVLTSAILFSICYTSTKLISKKTDSLTVLFMMSIIQVPISGIFALSDWKSPNNSDLGWLLTLGILSLTAHLSLTNAIKHTSVIRVTAMDLFRLPTIAILGFLFYQEAITLHLFIGILFMLAGNILLLRNWRFSSIFQINLNTIFTIIKKIRS